MHLLSTCTKTGHFLRYWRFTSACKATYLFKAKCHSWKVRSQAGRWVLGSYHTRFWGGSPHIDFSYLVEKSHFRLKTFHLHKKYFLLCSRMHIRLNIVFSRRQKLWTILTFAYVRDFNACCQNYWLHPTNVCSII